MATGFLSRTVTPAVKEAQVHYYGKARELPEPGEADPLGPQEMEFISARDSFYMSTVGETGWPYLQHRGGPKGFLRVISPGHLAFADFKGNRQMLTVGNVRGNDRACLFLMDYPNRTRLKILGNVEVHDARTHAELAQEIALPDTQKAVERIFVIRVASFDWNCPQYITPRFDGDHLESVLAPLKQRILELETQLEDKPEPS